MSSDHQQIEKGRKRLKLLIGLGLAIPVGLALLFFYWGLREFYSNGPVSGFFYLKEEETVFALFFLILGLIGFWIARAMYNGREWAHTLWYSTGFFVGALIFMISAIAGINNLKGNLPNLIISFLVLLISLVTALSNTVKVYLNSKRPDEMIKNRIDEIGKAD
jgi:hypothetical protein